MANTHPASCVRCGLLVKIGEGTEQAGGQFAHTDVELCNQMRAEYLNKRKEAVKQRQMREGLVARITGAK